jgi:hypothetical protein
MVYNNSFLTKKELSMSHSKKCVVCGETKEVNSTNFFPSKFHDADGYSSTCAACNIKQCHEREAALAASSPNFDPESGRQQAKLRTALVASRKREIDLLLKESRKECSCCHEIKELSEFTEDPKTYTKYSSRCRVCAAKAAKVSRESKKEVK